MRIGSLKTNHLTNPMGYEMSKVSFSWIVEEAKGNRAVSARVIVAEDEALTKVIHDSGERGDISSLDYDPGITLKPATAYYWQVEVKDDAGDYGVSPVASFETAALFTEGRWIKAPFDKEVQPLMRKDFAAEKEISVARLYICGLGLYEAYLNGEKIGEEFFAPYCNDYSLWIQYQTYDITELVKNGDNCLGVMLGNGWYKGRFGFEGDTRCLFGDTCKLKAEIHLAYADGTKAIIPTDESWLAAPSPVLSSGIYDGEVWDARKEIMGWCEPGSVPAEFVKTVVTEGRDDLLTPRFSLPVKLMETVEPDKLITTPAGEQVMDFGQEMTGWVEFYCDEPAGKEVFFQFGELLQNDNFYNGNLRSAKQEYKYVSDGTPKWVRPHFAFYGFRYMKICGISEIRLENFKGRVLYSEMERTGNVETSNPKVNRLILNALWGQKGNYLDVPTDCPQRDERMGWTGDAQVFSQTASFNLYTPAFFRKYLYDMKKEQRIYDGAVPHVVPDVFREVEQILNPGKPFKKRMGACAWSDAAAVIPWTVYRTFGDKTLLSEQYENMKSWVDFVRQIDKSTGDRYLWATGFHFGDWLALDNYHTESRFGATDNFLVASAYYYYCSILTAKAAKVLGKTGDETYYRDLAARIKTAFIDEYYTKTGRLAVDTQTALVLVLWLALIPEGAKKRQVDRLIEKLKEDDMHLTTGFVGTPILCPMLTENGYPEIAYTLLLNEDFPGWLYEVNLGATTIWERWNSVLPDGSVSDTGMNSLNHYAYGSIVEWIYRYMCGLDYDENNPGFARFTVKPYTDERFDWVKMSYRSAKGLIRCEWTKKDNGILYTVEVPFDSEAEFVLSKDVRKVTVNGSSSDICKAGDRIGLTKGIYQIFCA